MRQLLRIVVLQNKQTGDMYGFKMAVIPDWDYMRSLGDSLENNSYLHRDSKFRGLIMFYSIQGEFVNGWQYKDADTDYTAQGAPRMQAATESSDFIAIEYCRWVKRSSDGGVTWTEPELQYCTTYLIEVANYSIYLGNEGGYNLCEESGGGNPSSANEVDAKKIFKNQNMSDDNWKIIQDLINKITDDCLGESLFNALDSTLTAKGQKLYIQFGSGSTFNYENGSITIDMNNAESNRLFHEMWHAYQAYQETQETFKKSLLNQEMESWYAQYLYLSGLPEFKQGSIWYSWYYDTEIGNSIRDIKDYVDNNGKLLMSESLLHDYLSVNVKNEFKNVVDDEGNYPYRNYPFDSNRSGAYNFRNLKTLSINCD